VSNYTRVIVDYSYESGVDSQRANSIAYAIHSHGVPLDRQLWIVNTCCSTQPLGVHWIQVDHFLLQAHSLVGDFTPSLIQDRERKGLCLTGKLHERSERIRCLGELWRQDLWERMTVSTLCDTPPRKTGYGGKFERACVTPTVNSVSHAQSTSSGWPAPREQYTRLHSSLVLERFARRGVPFITEKTYRTIVHGHPFVIYGQPGTTDYLETLGFDTFRSVTGKYDQDGDVANSVSTVRAYGRLLDSDSARLQQGIEQNLMRLEQLAVTEKLKLEYALEKFYPNL